jgi:hypothetical protein
MATNAQHSRAWINIQRAQQSMHALEFFISTSQSNFVTKRPRRLTRSASLCATKSQPASNSLCTIVPSLHTPPLVRINPSSRRIYILFSLSALIIDPPIQECFCCERSCGKLIFGLCASASCSQNSGTARQAGYASFLSGKIVCESWRLLMRRYSRDSARGCQRAVIIFQR